jgi:hypothetical protein
MRSPAWLSSFLVNGHSDGIFRAIVVLLIIAIIIPYSSIFENEYHSKLANLYTYPWWRILIVLLLLAGASWCPRVGILLALVVFFYLSDMNLLISPLPNL